MANAFDQFDGAPTAFGAPVAPPVSAAPSQGQNAFDAFDGQPTAFGNASSAIGGGDQPQEDKQASIGSVAKNFGTGLLAGVPNAISGAEKVVNPVSKVTDFLSSEGYLPHIPTGGELLKKGMGLFGADPDNPDQLPQPQNTPERIARMAGEGTSGMLLMPEGAAESMLPRLGTMAKNAVIGGASGAGSEIGREIAPDEYKDVAGIAGGLLGGGLGVAAAEVPSAIGAGARAVRDYTAPFTESGQQRLAAKTLANAAADSDAALQALSSPSEIVPGSMPTTFQATGDTGLGQLERAVAAKSPQDFLERRAEQNSARLNALSDIQSEGHPEAVGSFFRSRLDEIDQRMQAIQDQAATSARSATEGLGGGQAADALGEQTRTALQNSLDAAKANERSLWKSVDPDGTMQVAASPLKSAYADVYGNLGPESSIGMTPVEKQLGDVIQGYGEALPLQRMIDLRSAISGAMRDANSSLQPNSIAYGRLTQLRGAVEDAISSSVAKRAAEEQQAVATGAMQPQETMLQRWQQEIQAKIDANRANARAVGAGGANSGTAIAGGKGILSGEMGTGSQAGSQAAGASGSSASQGTFIDQDTANRLKSATTATSSRKQTFGQRPVNQILQRPGSTQPYNMPGGAVSSTAWKAGAGGADAVNAILKASLEAVGPLKDIAASSLRSKAQDGVLTSKQLDAWKAQHGPALKALEQAAPGSTAAFENAAKAGDHFATLAQQRKDAISAVEKSAIGRLLKVDDPADVVKTVGSIFNRNDAVKTMRSLAQAASHDPAAMEGLRRAVVEHMESKLISNTEAGTTGRNLIKSDAFQSFLGKNYTALRQVFSDQELGSMRAIAQDLKRANRSISSKLPGGSNTAQDLAAMASADLKPTLLNKIITHAIGGGAGFAALGDVLTPGLGTLAGIVGTHVLGGMREAGIRSVEDLVRDAMLNPELAKSLLAKAPKKIDTGSEMTLANKLRRVGMFSAVQNASAGQ